MSLFSSTEIKGFAPKTKSSKKSEPKKQKKVNSFGKRYENCQAVIGSLKKGESIHYVSMGEWSMHDLLRHILRQTGTAKVYIATWSMSNPGAEFLMNIFNEGLIEEVKAVFDWRIKVRAEKALQLAKYNFADVYLTNCHAKVTIIENEEWSVSIVGSANYTNNPRIEAGVITESKDIADFHKKWILETIKKSDPFESKKNNI